MEATRYAPTEEGLRALCALWQERLRLQDWDVCVMISRERDFVNEDSAGECSYHLAKKRAIIRILDPVDFQADTSWPHGDQDVERTLVHELLHLHLAEWQPAEGTPQNNAMEQAVHALSVSLLKGYGHAAQP